MSGIWLVAFLAQSALLLILLVLVAGILRYLGQIQDRLRQSVVHVTRFSVGDEIPPFTLPYLNGEEFSSEAAPGSGRRTLLLLLTTTCASCEGVVRQVAELSNRSDGGFAEVGWNCVLACLGDREAVHELLQRSLGDSVFPLTAQVAVLVDQDGELPRRFQVSGLPTGMALDQRNRLIDQSANPGPNWVYHVLGVEGPPGSLVRSPIPTLHFAGDVEPQNRSAR